jgi:EmrB/QacA subfamily drug resistance transporter
MDSSISGSNAFASRRRAFALFTILTAQFMLAMDLLIVVVALPRIQQDLGFNPAELSWVLNAFGLAFGGLLLLGGRLGDMMGQVRAFRTGLAIFILASLLGGLATSPAMLLAARVLQGMGAALAGPSVLALVMLTARSPKEQARGMSLFISISSIGASAGLILGGVLTEYLSWRWSLLINVPVGIAVIMAIGHLVAETHPKKARLDTIGGVTATLGSGALVFGFINAAENGWSSVGTIPAFIASGLLSVAFIWTERRHKEPLLDLNLFQSRTRLLGLVILALINGVHFAVLFMLVQYFQRVLGYTPLVAGFAYLPLTAVVFATSCFVPRLISRFDGFRLLAAGSTLVALSLVGFAFLDENDSYFGNVLIPALIHAVGIALVFTPGSMAVLKGVPDDQASAA